MRYSYVENGVIIENNKPLPTIWANVSNFHLLDVETLKNYGWYKYTFVPADIQSNQRSDGSYCEIKNDEVFEYQTVREKTQEEISEEFGSQWENVRANRNKLLSESDWTQIIDSPFTDEQKEEWKLYRQLLRDITLQSDPFNISWPVKPGTENE